MRWQINCVATLMLLHLEQSESVFGHTQTNTWISTIIIGYQLSGMIIPKGGPLNKVIHDNSVIFPCFFLGLHIPVDERMRNYPKSWWTVGILFGSFPQGTGRYIDGSCGHHLSLHGFGLGRTPQQRICTSNWQRQKRYQGSWKKTCFFVPISVDTIVDEST